jgi:hypothetical protein
MLVNSASSILEILLGTAFLAVAFNRRWRAFVGKINPYSAEWLVMLLLLTIGLIEIYAGVSKMLIQRY